MNLRRVSLYTLLGTIFVGAACTIVAKARNSRTRSLKGVESMSGPSGGSDEYAQLRQEMKFRYVSLYTLLGTIFVGFGTVGAAVVGLGLGGSGPPRYEVFFLATPILLTLVLVSVVVSF